MWVTKIENDAIEAVCLVCSSAEAVIHNWQETEWASGMMEPVTPDLLRPDEDAPPRSKPPTRN